MSGIKAIGTAAAKTGAAAKATGNAGMLMSGLGTAAKAVSAVALLPMSKASNTIKTAKVIMSGIVLMTGAFESIKDVQKMQEIRQGKQLNEPLDLLVDKFKYVDLPTTVLGSMFFGGMGLQTLGKETGKAGLAALGKAISYLPAQCPWLLLAGAAGISGFYVYKSFANGTFKPADALLSWGIMERPHRMDDMMHGGVTVANRGYVDRHESSAKKYGIRQRKLSVDPLGSLKAIEGAGNLMIGNQGGQTYSALA